MKFCQQIEIFGYCSWILSQKPRFLDISVCICKQMPGGDRYAAFCHCINHVAILVKKFEANWWTCFKYWVGKKKGLGHILKKHPKYLLYSYSITKFFTIFSHFRFKMANSQSTENSLNTEHSQNTDLNKFVCPRCGKIYEHASSLSRHAIACVSEKKIDCTKCGKSFIKKCQF